MAEQVMTTTNGSGWPTPAQKAAAAKIAAETEVQMDAAPAPPPVVVQEHGWQPETPQAVPPVQQLPPCADAIYEPSDIVPAYWEDMPKATMWLDKDEHGRKTGKLLAVIPKVIMERAAAENIGYHVDKNAHVWLLVPVFTMSGNGTVFGVSMAANDFVPLRDGGQQFHSDGYERVGAVRLAQVNPWQPPVPQEVRALVASKQEALAAGSTHSSKRPF